MASLYTCSVLSGTECQKYFLAVMICPRTARQQPQLQEVKSLPTGTHGERFRTSPTSLKHQSSPSARNSQPWVMPLELQHLLQLYSFCITETQAWLQAKVSFGCAFGWVTAEELLLAFFRAVLQAVLFKRL